MSSECNICAWFFLFEGQMVLSILPVLLESAMKVNTLRPSWIHVHLQNLPRLCRYSSVWTYYGYRVQSPQIQSFLWLSEILPVQPITFSVYTRSIRSSYLQQPMLLYGPESTHLVTMLSGSVPQTIQICFRIHSSGSDVPGICYPIRTDSFCSCLQQFRLD